jgi:uncharacterized membrane protein
MNATKLTQVALLAAVFGASSVAAQAADEAKPAREKCYGIAKAGENSCAAANGSHSCAGQSKAAFNGQEFKDVPKGSCEQMNGSLKPFDGMNPKMKG